MTRGTPRAGGRSARRLVGDFFSLAGGEVLAKLAGIAAFGWLARALPSEAYGSVELAVALAAFFSLVVDFGFGPIGARELGTRPERAAELAAAVCAARLALAGLAAAALGLLSFALDQPPEARALIQIYALSLLASPWNLNWLFQGLGAMSSVAIAQSTRVIVFALGVVAFVAVAQDLWKVGAVEVGAAAAMAATYLLAQRRRLGPVRLRPDLALARRLAAEAVPVGLGRILWAANHYVSTLLVATLVGGAELAWFGAAHRIVTSLGTFVFLYHFNLYPQLVSSVRAGPASLAALLLPSLRIASWVGVLGGLLGVALAEPACRIVFGPDFAVAAPALAVLVWTLPASLLGSHARFALIAHGHQKSELAANAAGTAAVLALGLVCIGRWGALGAAVAMLGSTLVTWGMAQALVRRQVGPLPFLSPLVRPVLAAVASVALAAWLPLESGFVAGLVGVAFYAAVAPLLEPALVRDARALWRRSGVTRGGGAEP